MPPTLADDTAPPNGLEALFRPRSIAVIGAGREPTSMSGRLFRNLLASFRGPVYPINPNADQIESARAFPTILDVPAPVDLAFVAVPAASALTVVRQCLEKPVRGLVMITAGFSEVGTEGKTRERELLELVRARGVRLIGPNCVGIFNTDSAVQLQGTFAAGTSPPGHVGICTQSGALGIVIPTYLRAGHIGASTFVSIGNKADVNENDLLGYWRDDPATDVILLYLESLADAREFRRVASEVSRRKPIVALKAARTEVGRRAASSHTAALASSDRAADALFAQSGVLRVATLQELFDVASLLSQQPLPRGRRVAILTNAGGPGILCADTLAANGLNVPEFSSALQNNLRQFLRREASVKNPIDLIATIDPEEFRRCLELVLSSDEVDAVITIYVPRESGTSAAVARAVHQATVRRGRQKTSLAVFMQESGTPEELHDETLNLPCFLMPEQAATALAHAARYAESRDRAADEFATFPDLSAEECRRVVNAAWQRLGADGGWLQFQEVQALLAATGLTLPRWQIVGTADAAVGIAADWQVPVVLKVVSPTLLHKSDRGGVAVNVQGTENLRAAFQRVLNAADDAQGVLIQEFVAEGHEMLVGVSREPPFGHLVTVGVGGVFVELLNDVACRLHPLSRNDAVEMLRSLRMSPMLTGFRHQPPADVVALQEILLRVSQLLEIVPEIAELDLNPVKALPPGRGVRVVDARVRIAPIASRSDRSFERSRDSV